MSIEYEDDTNSQSTPKSMSPAAHQIPNKTSDSTFTPKPAAQQPFTQSRTMNTNTTPSMMAMTGRILDPLSANADAEAVKNFIATLKEETTGLNDEYLLTPIIINGNDYQLCMSVVVLALQLKFQGQVDTERGLSYHTLLLADTMQQVAPSQLSINGHNVIVPRPPGDAYDKEMREQIVAALTRQFPSVHPSKFFDAEAEVLPRDYNYKDKSLVRRTLVNALTALAAILISSSSDDLQDFQLSGNAKALNALARVSVRQPQSSDAVGDPIRSDIQIDLSELSQANNNNPNAGLQSINSAGQYATLVSSIRGFMDLMWEPAAGGNVNNPFAPPVQQNVLTQSQLYRPRLVITSFETSKLRTLPGQLFSLISVYALNDGLTWMSNFMPSKGSQFDMHDIGAIGFEANFDKNPSGIGTRIDTRSDSFREAQLSQLIHALLHVDPFISMDVAECGPETVYTSVFLAAAQGSPEATQAIYAAANWLTNGNFAKFHPMTGQAVLNDLNRIHLGYYTDTNGVKRDIRDVDYLAVLNTFGDKDPTIIKDWSDSFLRVDYPLELRMDGRLRIIEQALGGGATVTGFARRITFESKFISALLEAIKATGLQMRSQAPFQDISGAPRATAGYLGQAGLAATSSGLFNRGYGQQANPIQGMQNAFSRWR